MSGLFFASGGANRSRTGLNGFAGRCITALLSRHKRTAEPYSVASATARRFFFTSTPITRHQGQRCSTLLPKHQTKREAWLPPVFGAGDESRTRDLNLGKVALYQLSYSRINLPLTATATFRLLLATTRCFKSWSGRRVSNSRPQPWQGCALPTELLPHFAAVFSRVSRCLLARAPEKRDYVEGAESCQLFLYERFKILVPSRLPRVRHAIPPRSRICGHASFM